MNKNKQGFSKETLQLTRTDNRAKELRRLENITRRSISDNRWELKKAIKTLTDLSGAIPDGKTQVRILQSILPTLKAVDGIIVPDSMRIEVNNLQSLTDQIAMHVPDPELAAKFTEVRIILDQVLSTIPSE